MRTAPGGSARRTSLERRCPMEREVAKRARTAFSREELRIIARLQKYLLWTILARIILYFAFATSSTILWAAGFVAPVVALVLTVMLGIRVYKGHFALPVALVTILGLLLGASLVVGFLPGGPNPRVVLHYGEG